MAAPKGHPRYGGRTKGTVNRRTRLLQEAAALASDGAIDESEQALLEFVVAVSRNRDLDLPIRIDATKAACPYLHPRLNMVDASGA